MSWRAGIVALALLALVSSLATLDARPVGVVHDDAMYVVLARSLATGQGYSYLNLPGAPSATHFPPGYPALLALVSLVAPPFPTSVLVFKALNSVLLAIGAVLLARFVRERTGSPGVALATGAVSAVSVPSLLLGSMVMSEPLFLALAVALLAALERYPDEARSDWRAAALGAAIALCTLVRSHGVVLLPAALIVLALRRRWRDCAIVAGVGIVGLLPWQLWTARHAGTVPAPLVANYGSYAAWWVQGFHEMGARMIVETLGKTLPDGAAMLAALFSPLRGPVAHAATLVALGALVAAAVAASWRRLPVTLLFVTGYLAIVAMWPFPPARFVWGIWPLLLMLLVAGAKGAVDRRRWPAPLRASLVVAFAWIAAGYAAYEARAVRGAWWSSIARGGTARIVPAVRWTREHTRPDDLLASEDEGAVYLYTGRRAVPVLASPASQYLRERSPAQSAEEGLVPLLAMYPLRAVVVGSGGTIAAAQHLVTLPTPRLAPPELFPGGAAFTVLPR
jgi:4-amino-4-deoxy-L-arabinose transferase-like glycosyltransferase